VVVTLSWVVRINVISVKAIHIDMGAGLYGDKTTKMQEVGRIRMPAPKIGRAENLF
jgi:hypothetical protein